MNTRPWFSDYDSQTFTWDKYLEETAAEAAPARLFNAVRQEARTLVERWCSL